MKLQHITQDACPHCGARTIADITGRAWGRLDIRQECREFRCGMKLEYEHRQVIEKSSCPHTKEETDKRQARQTMIADLVKIAKDADVDEWFQEKIICDLEAQAQMYAKEPPR